MFFSLTAIVENSRFPHELRDHLDDVLVHQLLRARKERPQQDGFKCGLGRALIHFLHALTALPVETSPACAASGTKQHHTKQTNQPKFDAVSQQIDGLKSCKIGPHVFAHVHDALC